MVFNGKALKRGQPRSNPLTRYHQERASQAQLPLLQLGWKPKKDKLLSSVLKKRDLWPTSCSRRRKKEGHPGSAVPAMVIRLAADIG